jgi:AcrR family transcriptional regulator
LAAPAGRRPLSREVIAGHQRDRVLTAATEVIAKRGFNATTVDHIVSAAGIGVGTFYDLFDNKEDCFLQAYDRIVAEAQERIAVQIPAERPWSEQACAGLRALLELIAERPLDARLTLVEVQTAGPRALARYEETIDAAIPWFAQGRAESPVAEDLPDRFEEATIGGLAWILQQRLAEGGFEAGETNLRDVLEIAVEPYTGTPVTVEPASAPISD